MSVLDLSQWPRLATPSASHFRLRQRHVRDEFPQFMWVTEAGECPELVPGRLPLEGTEAARTVKLYDEASVDERFARAVSYTHLTLPTIAAECRYRWSPYH